MRLSVITSGLVALSLLISVPFLGSQLLSQTTPATPSASPDEKASSTTNAPTCLDFTQVKGPVIEFGRRGRVPYSIAIQPDGQIATAAEPPVIPPARPNNLKAGRLSPTTLKALIRLANAESFWTLPEVIGQKSNTSDESRFLKINLPCTSRSVVLHQGTEMDASGQRFAEMYVLLSDLVSGDSVRYKPLQ